MQRASELLTAQPVSSTVEDRDLRRVYLSENRVSRSPGWTQAHRVAQTVPEFPAPCQGDRQAPSHLAYVQGVESGFECNG